VEQRDKDIPSEMLLLDLVLTLSQLLAQSSFTESTSKRNGFSVVTNGKGFQLYADTAEERQAWKDAVGRAIAEAHAAALAAKPAGQRETRTFYVVSGGLHPLSLSVNWSHVWGDVGGS
jgi:hypothetical protein